MKLLTIHRNPITKFLPLLCPVCKRNRYNNEADSGICDPCLKSLELLPSNPELNAQSVNYCGYYHGELAKLIIDYKKGKNPANYRIIASLMADQMIPSILKVVSSKPSAQLAFCWPPGSLLSVIRRGYSHMPRVVKVLARKVQSALCMSDPPVSGIRVKTSVLFRRTGLSQQKTLGREERSVHITKILHLAKRSARKISSIDFLFIIDDVCTSGATLAYCKALVSRINPKLKVYAISFVKD